MKRDYIRPQVLVEEFVPNQAIASACSSQTSVVFDCMRGSDTDTAIVLSENSAIGATNCGVNAGYAERATKAVNMTPGGGYSTNSSSLTWSTEGGYLTATANADNVLGFLYICASQHDNNTAEDYRTNCWSYNESTGVLTHTGVSSTTTYGPGGGHGPGGSGGDSECYHVMIAPVVGVVAIGS